MKVSEYLAGLVIGSSVTRGAPVLKVVSLRPFSENSDDRRQVLTVELLSQAGGLELDEQE